MLAAIKKSGFEVELVDCTFMQFSEAVEKVKRAKPQIVGFYSMFSMKKTTLELASAIRNEGLGDSLFVVGGPLPSWAPESFLDVFDAVAVGEGEQTMAEIADCNCPRQRIVRCERACLKNRQRIIQTGTREFIENLDSLAFPTETYLIMKRTKNIIIDRFGYSITSMITSRGCPFSCDFCSRPIFGADMRTRSVSNIVDEVEEIASLGL